MWPKKFCQLFLFEGAQILKKLCMKQSCDVGSRFEALGVLGSKSCRKQTLIFFRKKWGSVFFNFLIRALLRSQIAIRIFAIFSRIIFSLFWPLKIKISGKKLYGHNPVGMLNHIGFKNFKEVEFWMKNRHFKNVVKKFC